MNLNQNLTLSNIRAYILGLCALLAPFNLPAQPTPSRYAFGLTMSQYVSMSASNAAQGYRPISLDANGPTNSPNIAAVWINDGFTNWTTVLGVTRADYSNQVALLSGQGYRTLCIDAYGDYPNERYVAVWVKDAQAATGWAQVSGLTESDYIAALNSFWNNYGYRPIWTSAIATNNGTPRYCGAWVKAAPGYGWSFSTEMNAVNLNDRMTNLLATLGMRPLCISGYNPFGLAEFAVCWVFAEEPVWTWTNELNAAAFQAAASDLGNKGYRPVSINEYGPVASPMYASTWVQDPASAVWTFTGASNSDLAALDNAMTNFMNLRNIERGTLAVTRNGKLVFNRAYTWGSTNLAPTQPTNLFRIAGPSRPLTSVAIFQLIQAGRISLDQQIGTILDLTTAFDPQFATVTIRQLLQDYGGWDDNISPDPLFQDDFVISDALNQPLPTTPQMIVDYMKTQYLNHPPGTTNVESNFGYCLLGRIIEGVTGMSYEQYVKANVLAPAGIWDVHLGKSLLADADRAEVDYQDAMGRFVPSVMGSNSPATVPIQYGGYNLSTGDSAFGWLTTASDLARFCSSFDVQTNSPLLPSDLINSMWSQPPELTNNPAFYYGCGWAVRPLGGGGYNIWHFGFGPGNFVEIVRRADGYCWAALFNRWDWTDLVPSYYNIDGEMNAAINSITTWPTNDLFDANGDGLLDAWQIHYFGSTTSPAAAPSADPDGDGANNWNEYVNLTDPTDPTSVEKLQANADPQNNHNPMLSWFAARGRVYTIETTGSLSSPNWQALAGANDVIGDNSTRVVTNSVAGTGFYRLRARLQRP
jgi:CubicO group peptidase (beta-lactamase class C family)